jgi:hypothetical protein
MKVTKEHEEIEDQPSSIELPSGTWHATGGVAETGAMRTGR